jgi:hypothetical protein
MLKRKTPLKSDPNKIYAWKQRTAKPLKRVKSSIGRTGARLLDEMAYSCGRTKFLTTHTICPVTGERTTQIHHSAKREGRWLLLQRYWIAVSDLGHKWIEENKTEAEKFGLMVRIRTNATEHISSLNAEGISLYEPLFYLTWKGNILVDLG